MTTYQVLFVDLREGKPHYAQLSANEVRRIGERGRYQILSIQEAGVIR